MAHPLRKMTMVFKRMTAKLSHYASRANYRAVQLVHGLLESSIVTLANYFSNRVANSRLIILDDCFPLLLSAFRIAEYNKYLELIPNAEVHSTGSAFRITPEKRSFKSILKEYSEIYPNNTKRIYKFHSMRNVAPSLFYTVFLNNAYTFIDYIERHNRPFMFTLYPGGGLSLGAKKSDDKLHRVLESPNFAGVIVTQKPVYDYLVDNKFCPVEKIKFVYGVVLPINNLIGEIYPKQYYQRDKLSFDICFVANKYMPQGVDKGYDVFINVAKRLSNLHLDIRFHVVGGFTPSDLDISGIRHIEFYGTQRTDFFPKFYAKMDIILSPNASNILAPGAFDGFPTGSCVEAGLCGVALFCTDDLGQNIVLDDRRDIVIISREESEICEAIENYYRNPSALYELALQGENKLRQIFDLDAQITPRLQVLSAYLDT